MIDRGSKKWSSLMLPEHKAMLKKLYKEESFVKKPDIDQQKLEDLNHWLSIAMEYNNSVKLTIYKGHLIKTIVGKIRKYDQNKKMFTFVDTSEKTHHFSTDMIIDALIV